MRRPSAHIFISFLLLIIGLIFFQTISMQVVKVDCYLNQNACPDEVNEILKSLEGTSLNTTPFISYINNLEELKKTPFRAIDYSIKIPGKLIVYLEQEEVLYSLSDGLSTIGITTKGHVVAANNDLPVIQFSSLPQDSPIDQTLHNQLSQIATIPKELDLDEASITWLDAFEVRVQTSNNTVFIFDPKNLDQGIWAASEIRQARIDDSENSEQVIDLRYKMPVLRTQ